jgi:hypothetical protein
MLDNYGYRHTLRICDTAFPRQQWLSERAGILRYAYIASLIYMRPQCSFLTSECERECTLALRNTECKNRGVFVRLGLFMFTTSRGVSISVQIKLLAGCVRNHGPVFGRNKKFVSFPKRPERL